MTDFSKLVKQFLTDTRTEKAKVSERDKALKSVIKYANGLDKALDRLNTIEKE